MNKIYFSIGAASEQLFRRQVELCGVTVTLIGELLPSIRLLLADSYVTRGGVLAYYLSSTSIEMGILGQPLKGPSHGPKRYAWYSALKLK